MLAGVGLEAQEPAAVQFQLDGSTALAPRIGERIELLPVLRLLGAEVAFSPAAGTYGVQLGEHAIQFSPDRQYLLVDGRLEDAGEKPIASPGGVAASLHFLERSLLAPLGFRLEPADAGFLVVTGARAVRIVDVRPVVADFATTTTLVLTLSEQVKVELVQGERKLTFRMTEAEPRLDTSLSLRSERVKDMASRGSELIITLSRGVGLLSWHQLDDPPRLTIELGKERAGPPPTRQEAVEQVAVAVVIDPGHGGSDQGAVASSGQLEKDLVLQIARRLAATLESRGYTVRLTRNGDEERALTDRTAVANRRNARAFISLHANSSKVAAVRGAETYYMSLDKSATDAAAAATARAENEPSGVPVASSPLNLILWDLAQAEVLNESARLALGIQNHLNNHLGLRDRGVKQAPFVVLTGATMPAALVEVGFVSNPDEEQLLRDASHQQLLAEAIALGVQEFLAGS